MIFGATIQYMGSGFGQSSSDVKKLQEALKAIQTKTKDNGYDPGAVDGTMRKEVVFALVYLINKVGSKAPGVSDLTGLIGQIPKAGTFIELFLKAVGTNRGVMSATWSGLELASSGTQKSVMDFVMSHASAFAKAVTVVGVFLGAGATTTAPPGAFTAFSPTGQRLAPTAPGVGTFPPGTVAIRDPALGKYRIITPA